VYNLPIFKQLIELLHWILVTINDALASWGLSSNWTWGLAIIGLTIIVRLVLFPLTWKQFASAQAMQAIQPKLKELQKKYKSDRGKLQQETMKLYQEHRVNPFASCLPLLLQLPVFIALYAAISGKASYLDSASVQSLYKAGFLWIHQWVAHAGMIPPPGFPPPGGVGGLGQPDPTHILLVLYVVTQLISTELMLVTQTDKTQKMIMRAMPIMFVFFLYRFPAGLFIYWVTTNLWTIGQQLLIRRMMKSKDLDTSEAKPVKPAKRSRFMEAIMSGQEDRLKGREALIAKQRSKKAMDAPTGDGAKSGGSAQGGGKQGGSGKTTRKPPPGKGKRKPGATPGKGQSKSGPVGG
jgi:YidC/Oxa1 family membrane protein insertase